MKLNAVHLNGLRAVEAAARGGSLQKAAEELGVSASAISQQIGRTEAQIGQAVFERTAAGLRMTSFGSEFVGRLAAGFRELEGAVALADQANDCVLVVSVAPAFAARWFVPRISRFTARNANIRLRIDATVTLVDLDRSDIDVAVRFGDGKWPHVRKELLLAQEIFPVCAPHFAAQLDSPMDIARIPVIADENTMISWELWFGKAGYPMPPKFEAGPSFSDPILGIDAAIAGQGIALAWQLLAADALADGRLVAPFSTRAASGLGYWLCTSEARLEPQKVSNFKSWIREEVEATARLTGTLAPAR